MTRRTHRQAGLTLPEILVAAGLSGLVMVGALRIMASSTTYQRSISQRSEASETARRTAELIGQELRSSGYGIITDSPYTPSSTQLSYLSIGDTTALNVLNETGFSTLTSTQAFSGNATSVPTSSWVALNSGNDLRLLQVTGTSGTSLLRINHVGCPNLISGNGATLSKINRKGLRYDAATQGLYEFTNSGEQQLAWNITALSFEYQYTDSSAQQIRPYGGLLLPTGERLTGIQIRVSATTGTHTRQAALIVPLSAQIASPINTVTSCP